jgi:uncharacterized protein
VNSKLISFADIAHSHLSFSESNPTHRIVLSIVDSPWFQRLRDVSQTAHTKLVYMFSEHSRFGHSLGVAYLADLVIRSLRDSSSSREVTEEVDYFGPAVVIAALVHDVGHLAPGSHAAWKAWFPSSPDCHEELGVQILRNTPFFVRLLSSLRPSLLEEVVQILSHSSSIPPWTWQVISGGGWNVDRGNWCLVDSILAGVNYGKYNIAAITESLEISPHRALGFRENRLDAMAHFAVSRHVLYQQVYHHRVLLAADALLVKTVARARANPPAFVDAAMKQVLSASRHDLLSLDTIFSMRESWWQYHLSQWRHEKDAILSDLSSRLIERRLFKTIRILETDNKEDLIHAASRACESCNLDPRYYISSVGTSTALFDSDESSLIVKSDDGAYRPLSEMDHVFSALSHVKVREWLVLPEEVKRKLDRPR